MEIREMLMEMLREAESGIRYHRDVSKDAELYEYFKGKRDSILDVIAMYEGRINHD